MADLSSILSGAWGTPGVPDLARSAISQAASSWGIPGDALNIQVPLAYPKANEAQLAKPSLDPGQETTAPVANVAKLDAQAGPGFLAQYGRMLAIVGGLILAVVLIFKFKGR